MREDLMEEAQTAARGHRSRLLLRSLITAVITRGVAGVTPLVLIPLTLVYLGQPVFGLWMTVLSLTSMALWSDFGLGSGLLTQLTRSLSLAQYQRAREQITSAYVTLSAVAAVVLAGLFVGRSVLDWPALLNAQESETAHVAPGIALVCLAAFAVNIPLALVQKIQYAAQEATASNLWQAVGSLASLGAAGAAVVTDQAPVVVVAAVAFAAPATSLVNTVVYFGRNPDLVPAWRWFKAGTASALLRLGAQFFGISLLTSVALNADNLIISHTMGLHAVADYSVAFRTLSALGLIITFSSLPFWSFAGDALARHDTSWVRRLTLIMSAGSAALVGLAGLAIVATRDVVFGWLSPGYVPSAALLVCIIIWWVVVSATSPLLSVQNAAAVVRFQAIGWAAFIVISIPAKVLAAGHAELSAIPTIATATYLGTVLPAAVIGYRKALRMHDRAPATARPVGDARIPSGDDQ